MFSRIADALLDFFRAAHARLYVRRGASAQQHQQQRRRQQREEEEEEEEHEGEDMMAPVGFVLSGEAPKATATATTTPPPPATTAVLAFRPAPVAEEERIE